MLAVSNAAYREVIGGDMSINSNLPLIAEYESFKVKQRVYSHYFGEFHKRTKKNY